MADESQLEILRQGIAAWNECAVVKTRRAPLV
jgi:hypothetical protein